MQAIKDFKRAEVLLVEDDESFRSVYKLHGSDIANFSEFSSFDEASNRLSTSTKKYDVIFVDLNLDPSSNELNNEGLKLIPKAKRRSKNVIVVSSVEDKPVIEQAFELGATRYYRKSRLIKDFRGTLFPLILSANIDRLKDFFKQEFLTTDEEIKSRFRELVLMGLNYKDHVFIEGPTGVGKSLIAKGLHSYCGYPDKDFFHLSIADLKNELVESELFGHKRGSFSGAIEDKAGILEKCDGKTLFIDDIDLLEVSVQGKLLVFLSHGTFTRVGETKTRKSSIRLISASNRNLMQMISDGKFRDDFYSRINKRKLTLTPLSKRRDDIGPLLDHYISKCVNDIYLDTDARKFLLQEYTYPGNVRELESIVAQLSATDGKITKDKLPQYLFENSDTNINLDYLISDSIKESVRLVGLKKTVHKIEEQVASLYLNKHHGRYTPVSHILKISPDKMKAIINRIESERS